MNDLFVMADEYKELCAQANGMCDNSVPEGADAGNGWVKVEHKYDQNSNCKVVLYKKGEQYAICFVGTDNREKRKDWGANIAMAFKGESKQIKMAREFTKRMMKDHNLSSENTVSIGHSEGGTEATHVGLYLGLKTFTYNAFGISKKYLNDEIDYSDWIINFRDKNDSVSKLKGNIGSTYILQETQANARTPFGTLNAHGVENMPSCVGAIPVEDYKKEHRWFLDHLTDAALTGENVDLIAKEGMYDLFEPAIMESLSKGEIYRERDIKSGRIWVAAYTRDDGTPVDGYYRRLPEKTA